MNALARLGLALLLLLAGVPAFAQSGQPIRVAEIRSERDCRLYETYWGGWLILECRNNFAALRDRLQSALAESGRFRPGAGAGYVVTGAITELGVTSTGSTGRDYGVSSTRATASLDLRVRDSASGRIVYAGTVTKSVEVGMSVATDTGRTDSASSPRAVYAALQREVSLAAARAIAFQVDPLRVTAVSGRQIRLNYGAPLLDIDATIQVADAAGFPVRFRVTNVMPDGVIADLSGSPRQVMPGATAMFIEDSGPGAGMNRFARVELPGSEEIALAGVHATPPPAFQPPPVQAPQAQAPPPAATHAPQAMRSQPGTRPRQRLQANRADMSAVQAATGSGPRVALVIGVGSYRPLGTFPNLGNPVNDARALADALTSIGFDVDLVIDPDLRTMRQAISRLGERIGRAGRGTTGLFYFAGHGVQLGNTNFLIPAQAPIQRDADLELEAVSAQAVLRQLEEAPETVNIVILDACRDLPESLTRSFRSAGGSGLAAMRAPRGSFIAFSTAPDAQAQDGDGANSPFAAALVREIVRPGQAIEETFRNVRVAVLEQTNGQQTPWENSSLTAPFFFRPR